MSASQCQRALFVGVALCACLALLLGRFGDRFHNRWRHVRDGMTQPEVRQALGPPTWTEKTMTIGAGDQALTRWEYKRGHCTYCIDFDYLGAQGAPVVYTTLEEWRWPFWFPWPPRKARA